MKDKIMKPDMQKLRPELGEVVGILEARAPYGAVSLDSREITRYYVDNSQERVIAGEPTAGTVLRAYDGHTMHEKGLGGFNQEAVTQSARDLVAGVDFSSDGKLDPGKERSGDFQTEMETDPALMPTGQKLDYLRDLNQRVRKIDSQIVNVRVNLVDIREKSVFRNRVADLAQDIQRLNISVLVMVMGEQGVVYDYTSKCGAGGLEMLTFNDEELEELVRNAIKLKDAERIEPGEYTLVTAPGVSGVIAHESFGHGVETDMFLKERAKAAHFVGKRVGSDLVNIIDDPSLPGEFGSYFFDDEGFPAQPTQIVKNGIFTRGLTDLYSSTALEIQRSPNGRRQDFTRKVYPRMTNTFFASGDLAVDDLIGQVDEGIYVSKVSSGMEDPKGWGIQVSGHYAFEIKAGKLTDKMYAPVGITGYVPDVLGSISGVASDFSLSGGYCGKGTKETVPVTDGGPHLLMKARLG
ncbi:MAG: TldD/PmbA family protein [Anaerolineales bacterium]